MTYHYRDTDGHQLEIAPERHWNNEPVVTFWARNGYATVPVRIPVDRLEELIAGARDTARQAASQEQPA